MNSNFGLSKLYKVDTKNEDEAIRVIYSLLSDKTLTNPECTVVSSDGKADIYNQGSLPPYLEFVARFKSFKQPIHCVCVAGLDKDDLRRASVAYMPEAFPFLSVNFTRLFRDKEDIPKDYFVKEQTLSADDIAFLNKLDAAIHANL